jgi:DNA-directed RNA polymerase subunit RPC12/RpoP
MRNEKLDKDKRLSYNEEFGFYFFKASDALAQEFIRLQENKSKSSSVHCSRCGKSVSNTVEGELYVRAFVECPECVEKQYDPVILKNEYKRYIELKEKNELTLKDLYDLLELVKVFLQSQYRNGTF